MMPPTITNLRFLAALRHGPSDALTAGWADRHAAGVLPKMRVDEDGSVVAIAMPGDPDYDALD